MALWSTHPVLNRGIDYHSTNYETDYFSGIILPAFD